MSNPINLDEKYGEIPENTKQERPLPDELYLLLREIQGQLTDRKISTSGIHHSCETIAFQGGKISISVIPIEDKNGDGKGVLVSNIEKGGKPIVSAQANAIILWGAKEEDSELFFTEYGQSFSDDEIKNTHLEWDDAQKLLQQKDIICVEETPAYQEDYVPTLFSLFSRRLAECDRQNKLAAVQKRLAYCQTRGLMKGALIGLQPLLPGFISSYEKATEPTDKGCLNSLKAVQQTVCRMLDPNLDPYPWRVKAEIAKDSAYVTNLAPYNYSIGLSIKAAMEIKETMQKKGQLSEREDTLLKAIDFYVDCLIAIYAKNAAAPLQIQDLTCFEIATQKMKLAVVGYLKWKRKETIPVDPNYGIPTTTSLRIPDDPFLQIAYYYPSIYSQHLVEAKKYHADDLMYRWALQHAEEMGVPVGPYEKLDDNLYKRLSEVAKVDDPGTLLKSLDEQGLLKDLNLVGQRKNQISSIKKLQIKTSRDNGANAEDKTEDKVRKRKSNVFRSQISVNYLSKNSFLLTPITLTAQQEKTCHIPDDKVLLEMAGQAYWQSGYSKNLINAVTNKKDRQKYAVKYLIYKLRLEDYDEEDTEGSLEKLKERTILGKDLAQLDRPSMAKVILAAKVCGVKIDKDSQLRLNLLLQEPHVPSLFR